MWFLPGLADGRIGASAWPCASQRSAAGWLGRRWLLIATDRCSERSRSVRKSSQVRWPTARSGARSAPARYAPAALPGSLTGRIGRCLPRAAVSCGSARPSRKHVVRRCRARGRPACARWSRRRRLQRRALRRWPDRRSELDPVGSFVRAATEHPDVGAGIRSSGSRSPGHISWVSWVYCYDTVRRGNVT